MMEFSHWVKTWITKRPDMKLWFRCCAWWVREVFRVHRNIIERITTDQLTVFRLERYNNYIGLTVSDRRIRAICKFADLNFSVYFYVRSYFRWFFIRIIYFRFLFYYFLVVSIPVKNICWYEISITAVILQYFLLVTIYESLLPESDKDRIPWNLFVMSGLDYLCRATSYSGFHGSLTFPCHQRRHCQKLKRAECHGQEETQRFQYSIYSKFQGRQLLLPLMTS